MGVQPLSFSAGINVAAVAPQSATAFRAPNAAPAASASAFGFGASTTTSATPLTFGSRPAAPTAVASAGVSFGQPQASIGKKF